MDRLGENGMTERMIDALTAAGERLEGLKAEARELQHQVDSAQHSVLYIRAAIEAGTNTKEEMLENHCLYLIRIHGVDQRVPVSRDLIQWGTRLFGEPIGIRTAKECYDKAEARYEWGQANPLSRE